MQDVNWSDVSSMRRFKLRRAVVLLMAGMLLVTMPLQAFANADPRIDLLNGVELNPVRPQSDALNDYLDELLPTLVDEEMDTYRQVRACYDYLVDNLSYGSHMANLDATIGGVSCNSIYNNFGEVEGFGGVALSAKVGMCNAYNSAFILMVRKLGLTANLVEGSTRDGAGGYSYHKWTEVTIDGTVYVFDPQLEQNLVASGLAEYTVFCRAYDEIPGRYIKS